MIWIVCVLFVNCSEDSPVPIATMAAGSDKPSTEIDPEFTKTVRELVLAYLERIDFDFAEVDTGIAVLQTEIARFLESPTQQAMDSVRNSWLNAHIAYELTTLHQYFAEQVLPEQQGLALFQLQYQINSWPILPGYIDYVADYPDSGIVHDITVELTIPNLREQHGTFDLAEATLGFHVLEFLLWGSNPDKNSPRPVSDYFPETELTPTQIADGILLDQRPNNRRRRLITLTSEILAEDFSATLSLWTTNSILFRQNLEALNGEELLSFLTESTSSMLTDEILVRSLYPLLNGEFGDSIQSPYSHSTQSAVSAQLSGIERLLLESTAVDGTTLDVLLVSLSDDFSEFFYQNFDASKECLVLLYSTLQLPLSQEASIRAEYEIVECINLLTNMVEHLQQIEVDAN